jgi:serine/threonine-protein phosphatase PGAM5
VPVTTLYLTRHGEQEHGDPAAGDDPGAVLTAAGVRQAHALGRRLERLAGDGVRFGALRHGPLPRAAQTAATLATYLPGVPVTGTDLLQDRTPIPLGAAADAVPGRYRRFLAEVPADERDEGAARLSAAFAELTAVGGHDRTEVLVTHTFVIGWFVRQVLDAPAWRWLGLNHAPCGLTTIAVADDRPPALLGYNDVGHLP